MTVYNFNLYLIILRVCSFKLTNGSYFSSTICRYKFDTLIFNYNVRRFVEW